MDLTKLEKTRDQGEEGVWVEWDDARFKIRSTSSKAYRKAIQRASKGKSSHRLTKDLKAAEKFGVEAMADGLLIDWENITENGKPLECNRENRIKVLTVGVALREFLATEAQAIELFEQEVEEEDAATFQEPRGVDAPVQPDPGDPD